MREIAHLQDFFGEGIYNFVTATTINEQEKELLECITADGKQYKDSIRYRKIEQITNAKDKIIIKKEYKKIKQCVTIAIAGSQGHIGTTSQAISITKFLSNLKLNVCYIQANGKEDIQTLENLFDIIKKDDFITYQNIDMYSKNKTVNAVGYGYDFYVYDMGVLTDITDIDTFITKDVKIIISGTKSWEQDYLLEVFNKLEILQDINFIFNFTPEQQKKEITKNMGRFGIKTYFSNYIPDPFIPDENDKIYHSILKDFITEKSSKLEVIPVKKKNILDVFRKGRE